MKDNNREDIRIIRKDRLRFFKEPSEFQIVDQARLRHQKNLQNRGGFRRISA
jgi:hypothetical protein